RREVEQRKRRLGVILSDHAAGRRPHGMKNRAGAGSHSGVFHSSEAKDLGAADTQSEMLRCGSA
ncbi:MAG TPA: hypothetical protein VFI22_12050, partial [Thermomicrobiales bacterium]|nr:hypothetical protein [Thermomicrobiales bacterium]